MGSLKDDHKRLVNIAASVAYGRNGPNKIESKFTVKSN